MKSTALPEIQYFFISVHVSDPLNGSGKRLIAQIALISILTRVDSRMTGQAG